MPVAGNIPFDDVSSEHWSAGAVAWASEKEIVKGISDSKFAPNSPITREQLASIMYRYANLSGISTYKSGSLSKFTDNKDISSWAEEALSWAVSSVLVTGRADNTLDPTGTATRAETAVILQRYMSLMTNDK